jgi:drug/metabolite transporter (DMT)-like permease
MRKKMKEKFVVFWMIGWSISYGLLTVCMKYLGATPTELVLFFKSIFGLIYLVPIVLYKKLSPPRSHLLPWYLGRAIIGYLAMRATYSAYGNLPLSTVTAIGFIEPLIVLALSVQIFGLKVSFHQWFFISLAYAGVLVMNYPIDYNVSKFILIAFFANFFASVARLMTKEMTGSSAPHQVMFYGNILGLCLAFFTAYPKLGYAWSRNDFLFLVGASLCSTISQYCYMQAISMAHFDRIGPLTYMRLVVAVPLAYYFFGEIPTRYVFVGSVLIVTANYATLFKREAQSDKEEAQN